MLRDAGISEDQARKWEKLAAVPDETFERELADEYDAAQERGEVASGRDGPGAGVLDGNAKATNAELGLTRKDIHEARRRSVPRRPSCLRHGAKR